MSLRFRKSINLGGGAKINLSKSGPSFSFGKKGARVTVGKRGVTRTVGIPGTGIYDTKTTTWKNKTNGSKPNGPQGANNKKGCGCLTAIAVVLVIIFCSILGRCSGGSNSSSSAAPVAASVASSSSKATNNTSVVSTSSATPTSSAPPKASSESNPAPTQPAPAAIKLVSATNSVSKGDRASVTIKGKPNTQYNIDVEYDSGSSKAKGLDAKTSDSNGNVTWSWKIGTRTKATSASVVITGDDGQTCNTDITIK